MTLMVPAVLIVKTTRWGEGQGKTVSLWVCAYIDKHGEKRIKLILTDLYAWYCILLLITKGAYFQFKFLFQVTCKKKKKRENIFLPLLSPPYLCQTLTVTATVWIWAVGIFHHWQPTMLNVYLKKKKKSPKNEGIRETEYPYKEKSL